MTEKTNIKALVCTLCGSAAIEIVGILDDKILLTRCMNCHFVTALPLAQKIPVMELPTIPEKRGPGVGVG